MSATTTKGWGDLKKPSQTTQSEIERVKLTESTRVRFIGDVKPRYVRWVELNEGGRRPLECISFDPVLEEFTSAKDPFDDMEDGVYNERPSFAYVSNVIDRLDGKVKLLDLKATIFKQLVDYAKDPEYGSPSDPVTGYDITIKKESTGPLPMNVKYSVMPSRNSTPLTEEEKELKGIDLDVLFKRPTYQEQKEWLLQNTSYFAGDLPGDMSNFESAEDL